MCAYLHVFYLRCVPVQSPDRYKDIEGVAMAMAQNVGGEFWPTSSLKGTYVPKMALYQCVPHYRSP